MRLQRLIGDLSVAFAAQGASTALSLVTALLVPKVLSVTSFGYWQLFVLFSGYVGFFHLGLNDGVYLLNGGRRPEDVDSRSIKSQMMVGLGYQMVFGSLMVCGAVVGGFGDAREFVLVATSVYMLLYNAAHFMGMMFQAVGATRLYSLSVLLSRLTFALCLVVLLLFRVSDFRWYVAFFVAAQTVSVVYCILHSRHTLSARCYGVRRSLRELLASVRVGFVLMIANTSGMLVLGIARLVVDWRWGIEAFGQLSFGLSIVVLFMNFVVQVSMVLFPELRRLSMPVLSVAFAAISRVLLVVAPLVLLGYFPMVWLVSAWLPQYSQALYYLSWLLPICLFDAQMSVGCATFLKVLRREGLLLIINLVTLGLSAVAAVTAVLLTGDPLWVVLSCTLVISARSSVSSILVGRLLGLSMLREVAACAMVSAVFVVTAQVWPWWLASISIFCTFVIGSWLNARGLIVLWRKVGGFGAVRRKA